MHQRLFSILVFCLGLAVAPLTAEANESAAFGVEAKAFVEDLAHDVIGALADADVDTREVRFRDLLTEHFAVRAIGQFVMGRYWRKASRDQKDEYLHLFEDFIVLTYANRFRSYSGETLQVISAITGGPTDAIVASEIVRSGAEAGIRIDWRVRKPGGIKKIVDVVVEGVSMSQTQRSDFGSVIRQRGGRVAGLIDMLREKTNAMRKTAR